MGVASRDTNEQVDVRANLHVFAREGTRAKREVPAPAFAGPDLPVRHDDRVTTCETRVGCHDPMCHGRAIVAQKSALHTTAKGIVQSEGERKIHISCEKREVHSLLRLKMLSPFLR